MEYALILAFIAVVVIAAMLFLGSQISAIFDAIGHMAPFGSVAP